MRSAKKDQPRRMKFKGLLFDLDGTVYRGDQAIPGAGALFSDFAASNQPFRFITNRSNRTPSTIASHLNGLGIPCTSDHVITSADAAAELARGKTVFCIGENGLTDALLHAGARVLTASLPFEELAAACPDFVIVGFDRSFDYRTLTVASRLVRAGAMLVSTNPDPFINSASGLVPENGALVAAVEVASDTTAKTLGKPEPFLAEQAMRQIGTTPQDSIIIGDNPDTDILCGIRAGIATALILTGVTSEADLPSIQQRPTYVVRNYDELRSLLLG